MNTIARQLHPWNRNFCWVNHRPGSGELDAAQIEKFDRDGFVVVPQVISSDELARTVTEIDAFEKAGEESLRARPGGQMDISKADAITFTAHLVGRSAWLRELSTHPRILGFCADLIGPDVRLYWDHAVYKKPETSRRFPWHQDNGYNFVEPQAYLTVWMALTDATLANGCPQVAAGLHRLGTLRHYYVDPLGFECFPSYQPAEVAEVPAGGAVLFSSLAPHLRTRQ